MFSISFRFVWQIASNVKGSHYFGIHHFGIQADEVADVSGPEQLGIYVCVIDQALPSNTCPNGAAVRVCIEYGIARVRGQ